MPFLGFGQFSAIVTGVYSALDILGKGSYEKLVKDLNKSYKNSLILRRNIEKLDNDKLDKVVGLIDGKLGENVFDNNINYLKYLSNILKPFTDKNKGE